jgi:hypothetical protein
MEHAALTIEHSPTPKRDKEGIFTRNLGLRDYVH